MYHSRVPLPPRGDPPTSRFARLWSGGSTTWKQIGDDLDGDPGDGAGGSVAVSEFGAAVAVGAASHANDKGVTRVYDFIEGSWVGAPDLIGEAEGDRAGYAVRGRRGRPPANPTLIPFRRRLP